MCAASTSFLPCSNVRRLRYFLSSGVCLCDVGMVCLRLFFLPRDSGEGGPPEGRWKGRGPHEISFDEGDALSQTPPPPSFACATDGPPPPLSRGRKIDSCSRGACAPEFCESHWQEPASHREICSVSVRSPSRV